MDSLKEFLTLVCTSLMDSEFVQKVSREREGREEGREGGVIHSRLDSNMDKNMRIYEQRDSNPISLLVQQMQ